MNTPSSSQNRIVAPILFGITFLVAIFLLKPLYREYIEKKAITASTSNEYQAISKEYESLKSIKNSTGSTLSPEKIARIKKLSKRFDTSDIMSTVLLNDFTKSATADAPEIEVASISVTPGKKLPNTLSLGNVSIALKGKTIADIIAYITYLTQDTDYIFTLDEISLPIDTAPDSTPSGNYSLSISLGVYYYE